jgi:hypothetical protein
VGAELGKFPAAIPEIRGYVFCADAGVNEMVVLSARVGPGEGGDGA